MHSYEFVSVYTHPIALDFLSYSRIIDLQCCQYLLCSRMTQLCTCVIFIVSHYGLRASLVVQTVERLPTRQETQVLSLVGKIPCRRKYKPPSRLAWKSHGSKEPQGCSLQGAKSWTQLNNFVLQTFFWYWPSGDLHVRAISASWNRVFVMTRVSWQKLC